MSQDKLSVEQEDVRVTTVDGHPAIEVGDSTVVLHAELEGAPPESAEVDRNLDAPFHVVEFPSGWESVVELTPQFAKTDEVKDDQ